jgi:hypothetical protein
VFVGSRRAERMLGCQDERVKPLGAWELIAADADRLRQQLSGIAGVVNLAPRRARTLGTVSGPDCGRAAW